ncbi:MAG: FMN-binding glutamate synthase family protein, partial [Chloroflexota bacterium]
MRSLFIKIVIFVLIAEVVIAFFYPPILWSMIVVGPLIVLGFYDYFQPHHAILRNFPIIGHFRYIFEEIRPEIYQYFIESDTDGKPFHRTERSLVYQRAKDVRDTVPFGTLHNVYEVGYEWVNHSMLPKHLELDDLRMTIG